MSSIQQMIEGYSEIQKEIEICRKYGIDYPAQRGRWREAVERIHPRRLQLRVSEIIPETAAASTLRLVAARGYLPPFQAGQYINLSVEIDGVRTGRPYSISSSPNQIAYYDITVRRVADGFVSDYLLDRVKAGDLLESTGPAGHFYHNPLNHGDNLVFLAGGSGITPFMSMIRDITDRKLKRKIHLLYGCRAPQDAIFHEELRDRSGKNENFVYDLVISDQIPGYEGLKGLLDAGLIREQVGSIGERTFYLCGPRAMYDFSVPELKKLDIPGRRIRQEVFGAPANVTQDPAWPVEVGPKKMLSVKLRSGKEIPAKASEPLLVAMERAGILVESCCRSGECSLCRVKLISGKVFQPAGALVRKSDKGSGYVHACAAYPLTDLELIL